MLAGAVIQSSIMSVTSTEISSVPFSNATSTKFPAEIEKSPPKFVHDHTNTPDCSVATVRPAMVPTSDDAVIGPVVLDVT